MGRARGSAEGRQHRRREALVPLRRAGLSCPPGGAGFVTDGSRPPLGGEDSPAGRGRRHSHPDQREALSPARWRRGPGGQRLVYLPNKPGEGGTGPPPCSDARPGTASPRQHQTHVEAHGSLLPLLCQRWAQLQAGVPGVPSLLPPQVPAGSSAPTAPCRSSHSASSGVTPAWPPSPVACRASRAGLRGSARVRRWDAGARAGQGGGTRGAEPARLCGLTP